VPTPAKPIRRRQKHRGRALATDRCSDPSVPKLDVPFRVAAPNATAAGAVLAAFQQAASGGAGAKQLTRGTDVFDASVLCGVASALAPASGPSPILSAEAIASLQELTPVPAPAKQGEDKAAAELPEEVEEPLPEAAITAAAKSGSSSGGSNGGAIGGAIVGVLLAVCAAVGVVYVRRQRRLAQGQGVGQAGGGLQV
jgi:hypothetical protein